MSVPISHGDQSPASQSGEPGSAAPSGLERPAALNGEGDAEHRSRPSVPQTSPPATPGDIVTEIVLDALTWAQIVALVIVGPGLAVFACRIVLKALGASASVLVFATGLAALAAVFCGVLMLVLMAPPPQVSARRAALQARVRSKAATGQDARNGSDLGAGNGPRLDAGPTSTRSATALLLGLIARLGQPTVTALGSLSVLALGLGVALAGWNSIFAAWPTGAALQVSKAVWLAAIIAAVPTALSYLARRRWL